MIEFGVKQYKSLQEFKNEKINIMCKPCLVFNGDQWSKSDELRHIKSLLVDMFHVEDVRIIAFAFLCPVILNISLLSG